MIQISSNFNFPKLLKFAFPSIVMMMFMSLYSIADGYFVSSLVGSNALAAVNIVFPLSSIIMAVSLMFATGGSAVLGKELGRGNTQRANRLLSLNVIASLIINVILLIFFLVFLEPILKVLGATDELMPLCKNYIFLIIITSPMSTLQILFQSYFITASKPVLGFGLIIAGGILNIILDYILIKFTGLGIMGASIATVLGYCVTGIGGLIFFAINKKGLHFAKPIFAPKELLSAAFNGSSEMVTNLSSCVITILFNIFMMKLAGAEGVAAITVILYAQFLLNSLFFGFTLGVAPVLSYNYGAQKPAELKRLLKMCTAFVLVMSVVVTGLAYAASSPIAKLFSNDSQELYAMILRGMRLFSVGFVIMGINIVASGAFTALSYGGSSALVSLVRTGVCTVIFIIVFAIYFGTDGIFLAVPAAEAVTAILSISLLAIKLPKLLKKLRRAE